ncbi:MAG: MMPL family transporter [Halioglobus sp.]|nr:MMPL family transporter [Halioglobus sp.]
MANDFRSSIVQAPLFDRDPRTGEPLDYLALSQMLETEVRDKFQRHGIRIHITGFAKMIGDLLEVSPRSLCFAVITVVNTAALLFLYSRSLSGTLLPLLCSIVAVIWQLGLLTLLGYGLNAYSILIPFLVFAIGVSHGVQIINGTAEHLAAGRSRYDSARFCFRNIYSPGMTALISDAMGFITMLLIEIQVIKDLGIAASVGVAVIILTNLVLLPTLLSYIGMSRRGVGHAQRRQQGEAPHWRLLSATVRPTLVPVSLLLALALAVGGWHMGRDQQIGDLDPGAPELHPDSRYNRDVAFINNNYSTSSDVLVVMVETPPQQCSSYNNMTLIDRFAWHMKNVEGVADSIAMTTVSRLVLDAATTKAT